MKKLLQWNSRGIIHQFFQLQYLVRHYDPFLICLQELNGQPGKLPKLRGYTSQAIIPTDGGRAHGRVAIYTRSDVHTTPLELHTHLQAVAVKISTPKECTVCCIYLPDASWLETQLLNLYKQRPAPVLFLGDFNAHHSLWGSSLQDTRGRRIESSVDSAKK